jgi:hypothetical protein
VSGRSSGGRESVRTEGGPGAPAPATPGAPRVSGAVILKQIEALKELYGRDTYGRALGRLPDVPRRDVEELLAIGWIPASTAQGLKDAVAALVGRTSEEVQVQVVRASLGHVINAFWRFLLGQVSDEALVKRTPLLYSRTFDRGELVALVIEPGHATFELLGWPDVTDYDALGLATGIDFVLEHAGRKGAASRWSRSGGRVIFEASWPHGADLEGTRIDRPPARNTWRAR